MSNPLDTKVISKLAEILDKSNLTELEYEDEGCRICLTRDFSGRIAGPAAAFINAGLVTITSVCILRLAKDPFNGFTIVEMGLMAGFSLFGKNMFNIWPIILGTWLYARYQREPFSKYASVALLSTSLAPLVSYMALGSVHASLPLGILSGVVVGFLMPSLSAYTYKVQNGMNLYNMGFACGLFAMMVVPVLTAFGDKPDSAMYWSTGHNKELGIACCVICAIFILLGFFGCQMPAWADGRRVAGSLWNAPRAELSGLAAGGTVRHDAGAHRGALWYNFWRAGRLHPLGTGFADRRPGGGTESL